MTQAANASAARERPSVLVIGGGLAGLAAASALAQAAFSVTVAESRSRLGGRASSFTDPGTGQLVDNCQHVSMRCCTNLRHFFETVGTAHFLETHRILWFMSADGRASRFGGDPLPAPFHLARALVQAHFLSWRDKLQIVRGLRALARDTGPDDPPFTEWLAAHRQSARVVERFWGVVLTSALNESPDRVGLRYARKVLVDGFLGHPRAFEVEVPRVPLARLYGDECARWFERRGVKLSVNMAVRCLEVEAGMVSGAQLRSGEVVTADWYVAALPFERLLEVLPDAVVHEHGCFSGLRHLEHSPITSVHLWYDRPVLTRPHVVLVGCTGQWVFNRGRSAPGEFYVQVVVSAARQLRALDCDAVQRLVSEEMARLFPAARPEALRRCRVVSEHKATFSAVPGVDAWRPPQQTPIRNLFLAGDWTATGWPATMEGAVRSGYLAAEAVCTQAGRPRGFLQPDLSEGESASAGA